mgnify:CR=1 FL=1
MKAFAIIDVLNDFPTRIGFVVAEDTQAADAAGKLLQKQRRKASRKSRS